MNDTSLMTADNFDKDIKIQKGSIEYNLEPLKIQINNMKEHYKNLVFTDKQIDTAKSDKAELNKMIKKVSEKRINLTNDFNTTIKPFIDDCKEIEGLIKEAVGFVDVQVKEYATKLEQQKQKEVEAIIKASEIEYLVDFPKEFYNPKWNNKSNTLGAIKKELATIFDKLVEDKKIKEEKEKLIQEKKELLEKKIEEFNESYNLDEKIRYTEVEYIAELSVTEIEDTLKAEFEARKENEDKFKEAKKETIRVEIAPTLSTKNIKSQLYNTTLKLLSVTAKECKLLKDFLDNNNFKYELMEKEEL